MNKKEVIQEFKNSFGGDELDYIKAVKNQGKTTIRCMFIDYVDQLHKEGRITDYQAQNLTATDKELCLTKRITVKGV